MLNRSTHKPPPQTGEKQKKKIPSLLIVAVMVALLMAGLPYARGFVIRNYGIDLKPNSAYTVAFAQAFLQNDERWAKDTLGASLYDMAGHGCLVCCIASVMVQNGVDTDPGMLNKILYEKGAYTEEGELIWEKLKPLQFTHEYQNDFSTSNIERLLKEGLLPLVKVKYKGNGLFHWVLIVGSNEKDFLILDSLNPSKEPVSLSTHGKVYAYRVLKRSPS